MKKDALTLYVCPSCHGTLDINAESDTTEIRTGLLLCKKEGITFTIAKGIPHLILPTRKSGVEQLCKEIGTVRIAQGLAIDDWGYYVRLPYPEQQSPTSDPSRPFGAAVPGPLQRLWRERAHTFERLYSMIRFDSGTTLLDLGAGCCWISNRLANRFNVIAMDIDSGPHGLGVAEAFLKSGKHFERCRGELANIPLRDASVDIVIMAASAEFEDLALIIGEIRRVLKPNGTLYIIDTPVFTTTTSHGKTVATLRSYHETLQTPILKERHQPLLMSSIAAELKPSFTVEIIPAERRIVAAKRSLASAFGRTETPLYPIIKARKIGARG